MKIILITYVTPTPDNFKAASALSFHLCKYRPENAELEIYSFNANNVSENILTTYSKHILSFLKTFFPTLSITTIHYRLKSWKR